MDILKRWIIINIAISITIFIFIFYNYAGKSGGDMAIIASNIIFGIFQILLIKYLIRKKKKNYSLVVLSIVISQVIELIIFNLWGYYINERN